MHIFCGVVRYLHCYLHCLLFETDAKAAFKICTIYMCTHSAQYDILEGLAPPITVLQGAHRAVADKGLDHHMM